MNTSDRNAVSKQVFRLVYAINYIIQAGFTLVCPAALIIFGGWWLVHRFSLGKWVMVTAILLGVFVGIYSMFSFILKTIHTFDPTQGSQKGGNTDGRKTGTPRK